MSDEKEKELIQQLKSMPDIKDIRNKDDLFDSISKHTSTESEPKRKEFNVVPLVAVASALFLVIFVPFLLNNNSNQMSDRVVHNESSDMGGEESISFSDSDSDVAEEESIEMASEEEQKIFHTTSDLVVSHLDTNHSIIQLTISDAAKDYSLPLSVIVPSDVEEIAFQEQLEQYLTNFKNNSLDQITIYPTDIKHDLKDVQSIKQTPVEPASYLLFDNQHFIKVIQEESTTISEAIAELKVDVPKMNATQTIPEQFRFKIREENDLLYFELEESQLIMDDGIAITMIESILLTAKSYGFRAVKFDNMPVEFMGSYTFEEPIEVPLGANPIYY